VERDLVEADRFLPAQAARSPLATPAGVVERRGQRVARARGSEVTDELRRCDLRGRCTSFEHCRGAGMPGAARRRWKLVDQDPSDEGVHESELSRPALVFDEYPVAHGALEVVGD